MRRRIPARALAVGALVMVGALLLGLALAPDLGRRAGGAPPAALNRIAQKNDRAAMEAAAKMRAQSRAAARAADSRRAAEERGRVEADATLARFDNDVTPATAEQ